MAFRNWISSIAWNERSWARLNALCVILSLAMLVILKPSVGGVDHLYYLLNSRDQVAGLGQGDSRFGYFPGVFSFWELAIRFSGGNFSGIQWVYLCILVLNGAVIGLIIHRVTAKLSAALLSVALYWLYCPVLEGTYGVTEPIGTLPILLAILAAVQFPVGSLLGQMILGVGLGFGVFVKQQVGLVSVGALSALLVALHGAARPAAGAGWVAGLSGIFVATVSAITSLVLLSLAATGSVLVLAQGLRNVGDYGAHGSLPDNLLAMLAAILPLSVAFAVSTFLTIRAYRSSTRPDGAVWLCLFCAIAVLASFAQFWKRHYLHYGLIPLPFMAMMTAIVVSGDWHERFRPSHQANARLGFGAVHGLRAFGIALLVASLWFSLRSGIGLYQRGPYERELRSFGSLCPYLSPGSDVFVFPPIYNQIHWVCRTRSTSLAQGYSWARLDRNAVARTLASETLEALVLVKDSSGNRDRLNADSELSAEEILRLAQRIELAGTIEKVETPEATIVLFRRESEN